MEASTELEPVGTTEVVESAEAQAVAAEFQAEISPDEIALPLVKLTQGLSKEVQAGKVPAGHFVNSVTGKDYGDEFQLVIAGKFNGRFYSPQGSNRSYVAGAGDVVPSNWPDEYAGKRFSELEDAEELFRQLVNDGAKEWGHGPPISTTYNYVGYLLGEPNVPVRISLMRTSAPARKTVNTLLKVYPQPWAITVRFAATKHVNSQGQESFKVVAEEGSPVPVAEQQAAVNLAVQLKAADVALVGDENADTGAEKPKDAEGAIALD